MGAPLHDKDSSGVGTGDPARPGGARLPVLIWSAATLVLASAAAIVLIRLLVETDGGQDLDQRAMEAVYAREDALGSLLSVLGYVSIGSAAVALAVLVILALVRRRYAGAVAAITVVAGANVTTQILKRVVIDRPDLGHGMSLMNSLPSGHTTVVTSVVLAALLISGTLARPFLVAIGSFAVTFTGASTLVAGWHRPADVLAALAVCLAWGSAAVFVLGLRRPARLTGSLVAPLALAVLGAGAAGILLVVIGVRPHQGWEGFEDAASVLGVIGLSTAATVGVFARISSAHAV